MSAVQYGDVAQVHVSAVLQADGFVADAGGKREVSISAAQAFAPDQPLAFDGDVFQILAPDQAVVPVAVTEVLKFVPCVGLGRIIAAACAGGRSFSRDDGRAGIEK